MEPDLTSTLSRLADAAPPLDWDRLEQAHLRDGRRRRAARAIGGVVALAGAGSLAVLVQSGTSGGAHRERLLVRPDTATASPSPTLAASPADARPATPAPAVRTMVLPLSGSRHLIQTDQWTVSADEGGRGTFLMGFTDADGKVEGSSEPIATQVTNEHGTVSPIPLDPQAAVTVSRLSASAGPVVVAYGAVARGTAGVAALDADGHRSWAQLVEPGPNFDVMMFAVQTTDGADLAELQTVDATGAVTSTRVFPSIEQPVADPGQIEAASLVTTSIRRVKGNSSDSFCLTEVSTGRYQCEIYFITNDPLTVQLRLGDGRLAVAGIAPPGYTSVTLQVAPHGPVRPIRLGLVSAEPSWFTWVGSESPQPPVTGVLQVPVGLANASTPPNRLPRSPVIVLQPGVDVTVAYTDAQGDRLDGPRPGQFENSDGHPIPAPKTPSP